MNRRMGFAAAWVVGLVSVCGQTAGIVQAQAPRQQGTLVIAGQTDEAPLVRINGKSYVDMESLARLTHGTLRFEGGRTILTLPGGGTSGVGASPTPSNAAPRLTQGFLDAEIAALAQIREWHVTVVNAVNNNVPVTETLVGPIERQGEAKLQLAFAAAASGPDQQAAVLLRAEFTNMQQMSGQLVQMSAQAAHISPDVFSNNALDAKILGCQNTLAQMAATKQYQDDAQCH